MFSSRRHHAVAQRGEEYATPCELARIFHDHADQLYTLSLLLTADHEEAERCFVAGLEDSLNGNPVFREWAESWARRIVIKNAIRIVSPKPGETRSEGATRPNNSGPPAPISEACALVGAITELAPFDRFVYVMSVLEKYSGRDCSTLLGCTTGEVVDARTRAFQQLARVLNDKAVTFPRWHKEYSTSSSG